MVAHGQHQCTRPSALLLSHLLPLSSNKVTSITRTESHAWVGCLISTKIERSPFTDGIGVVNKRLEDAITLVRGVTVVFSFPWHRFIVAKLVHTLDFHEPSLCGVVGGVITEAHVAFP